MHSLNLLEKLNNVSPSFQSLCTGPQFMLPSFTTKFLVLLQQSSLLSVNKCKDCQFDKTFQFLIRCPKSVFILMSWYSDLKYLLEHLISIDPSFSKGPDCHWDGAASWRNWQYSMFFSTLMTVYLFDIYLTL